MTNQNYQAAFKTFMVEGLLAAVVNATCPTTRDKSVEVRLYQNGAYWVVQGDEAIDAHKPEGVELPHLPENSLFIIGQSVIPHDDQALVLAIPTLTETEFDNRYPHLSDLSRIADLLYRQFTASI